MDELPPDQRTAFEKEMAGDEVLLQAVADANAVTEQLSALFESESTPSLTDHRRAAVINEPVVVRPEDEKSGRATLIAFLVIAATALAVIGLSPLLKTQSVAEVDQVTSIERSTDAKEVASLKEDSQISSGAIAEGYAMVPPSPMVDKSGLGPNRWSLGRCSTLETETQPELASDVQSCTAAEFSGIQLQEIEKAYDRLKRLNQRKLNRVSQGQTRYKKAEAIQTQSFPILLAESTREILIQQKGIAQIDFKPAIADGRGPGMSGDKFDRIVENDFIRTSDHPLSTFSVDVDTASYSKVRDVLMRANRMPRPDAVRIEEINEA